MDPCVRKSTIPSKVDRQIRDVKTVNERIVVTTLCNSPKQFAKDIIIEQQSAADLFTSLCENLLTEEEETINLISPIPSVAKSESLSPSINRNIFNDLDVSDTDSENTKVQLKKSILIPAQKMSKSSRKGEKKSCTYIIKKGTRKGQMCQLPAFSNNNICAAHRKQECTPKIKSSNLETKVLFLETKVKMLTRQIYRLSHEKKKTKLKVKNCTFTTIKKLQKNLKYYFVGIGKSQKMTLKCENRVFILKAPLSLVKPNLTTENFLSFDEDKNVFKWNGV